MEGLGWWRKGGLGRMGKWDGAPRRWGIEDGG